MSGASLERRIQQLERTYGHTGEAGGYDPERERLLEGAEETHRRAWEKALAEEASEAGDPRRRELLEELEDVLQRRRG